MGMKQCGMHQSVLGVPLDRAGTIFGGKQPLPGITMA
jgi:hypothetical protein